jgi:drug/metabolite transporter (DMT)-like permease
MNRSRLPGVVIGGLILAVVLDTIIQITWKRAVAGIPDTAAGTEAITRLLRDPFFYVAMMGFAAQLYNWLRVLAHADLSFAQPITALSYISVLAISNLWLHERVSAGKVAGIALILVGVALISRTPARTAGVDADKRTVSDLAQP